MPIPELLPGDCLLYFSKGSLLDWLIAIKTWNKIAHCEVYAGGGFSLASRNGLGVNRYNFRLNGLAYVLRPRAPLDFEHANNWFSNVKGQGYDWLGLLVFTLAVKRGSKDKMFCSEFETRYYRQAGLRAFADHYDADRIAPAQFLQSPAFDWIWWHEKAKPRKAGSFW